MFNIIVCVDSKNGIAKNNTIPWALKPDILYFKKLTTNTKNDKLKNAVIMGRKTWDSLPSQYKPLKRRLNIVISRSKTIMNADYTTNCFEKALTYCTSNNIENIFVIGGTQIYNIAIQHAMCQYIYITRIHKSFKCDLKFPKIPNAFEIHAIQPIKKYKDLSYQMITYSHEHKKHQEYQYLHLLNKIIKNGALRKDRTGVGVKSIFGCQMRFNLKKSFPLLTTKRMYWKGIAEELIWFLRGDTNAKHLQEKKVHIWDGNSTRKYLDSIGLHHLEEGDCGPIYGFNFRHFGANYINCHTDYKEQGVDQIKYCLNLIKNNPTSRRILINLWNPCDLKKVSLPACHVLYQFYVNNGYLSCSLYQRSGDMGLGVPFNIASASLLTYIFAHVTNLKPGELIHTIGDAHVYTNHIPALQKQLLRSPRPFPFLYINNNIKSIKDIKYDDLTLCEYYPQSKIFMKMAV